MKRILYIKLATMVLTLVLILSETINISAAETSSRFQAWRFGLNAAMQSNSAALGWQELHGIDPNFQSPKNDIDLVDGTGVGGYFGIFGEYLSSSWWGIQTRISYDQRDALVIDKSVSPIPSFETKMSYLTIEPLFRADQSMIPNLNFYAGPFIAFNLKGEYVYKPDKDKPMSESNISVKGLNKITYGFQGGLAYDIMFLELEKFSTLYISPFFDVSWIVNQKGMDLNTNQNSIADVWSTLSYRFGLRLSYQLLDLTGKEEEQYSILYPASKVNVSLPEDNTIVTKKIIGYFPIHPYVFFDKESSSIPSRYNILSKAEAKNFNESSIENFMQGDLTTKETNVNQLMRSYYNVLNIYGDRLRKNPSEKLTLVSSDIDEGSAMSNANTIKNYLITNYEIDPSRISISIEPPRKQSGSELTEAESLKMIADENRRVTFVFNNPKMTESLQYTIRDESSIDNDMIFSLGKDVEYKSWDISIVGESKSMYFGPFESRRERINPAELMRFLQSGSYTSKVTITDKFGVKTSETIDFKLNKETELKNATRYLMLFDYNQSDAIKVYEQRIRNEIVPGIADGDKVIVHGHTDIIGTKEGNRILSQERSDAAKAIIVDQLSKEKRSTYVQSIGIGQDKMQYTFDNKFPEGRMYNRNIFIEIIK